MDQNSLNVSMMDKSSFFNCGVVTLGCIELFGVKCDGNTMLFDNCTKKVIRDISLHLEGLTWVNESQKSIGGDHGFDLVKGFLL